MVTLMRVQVIFSTDIMVDVLLNKVNMHVPVSVLFPPRIPSRLSVNTGVDIDWDGESVRHYESLFISH